MVVLKPAAWQSSITSKAVLAEPITTTDWEHTVRTISAPYGIRVETHLGPPLPQLLSILVLCRVKTDPFVQVTVCDRGKVWLLRSDARRLYELLGDSCVLARRCLELDSPPLDGIIILCRLDLGRGDNVQVESCDVFAHLFSQIVLGEQVWRLELLGIA